MKQNKKFTWLVMNFDANKQVIEPYDVLAYRESDIKKMKKKCSSKEELSELLEREMMYYYWSKAEFELLISLKHKKIKLTPWCGCYHPEFAEIEVKNELNFDWLGFALRHLTGQTGDDTAKIDVYDQLKYKWDDFVNFCWEYHHKWQRNNKKEKN